MWCVLAALALAASSAPAASPAAAGAGPVRGRARATAPDGARVCLVLRGGRVDGAGILRGAGVAICDLRGRVLWDGFDRALNPWLLGAGRFAGKSAVLVGVTKACPFDRREAPRPFLYALQPGGQGLSKLWLGTSLARPFVAAGFAHLGGRADDELVALERTASGALALGAYRWEGFGVEGLARSEEIPGAREMRCPEAGGDRAQEVVVRTEVGQRWRFLAYSLRGERLVAVAESWATVGPGAVRWEATAGGIRLSRRGFSRELRRYPLAP